MRIAAIIDGFRGTESFRRHLDIGSSTGALLATVMDKFRIPVSVGVEPNEAWRAFAKDSFDKYIARKKIEDDGPREMAFHSRIEEAPGAFDLITISHVIEHIPDLDTEMTIISEKLSADGVLYIEAPFAFGGISDPMMFPHIHVFTHNSLGLLVENHGMYVHRLFLEGSSAPFWPPHQHLIMLATKAPPGFQKSEIMIRYINGRDAVRRATEQMKQAKPTYDLG
jgi:SAM-dependent methyltransferase